VFISVTEVRQGKGILYEKIEENCREDMNGDVCEMIGGDVVTVKVIVQGEADVCDWPMCIWTFGSGVNDTVESQFLQADVWVFLDVQPVIEEKRSL